MDRRGFLKSSVAAGVVCGAGCRGDDGSYASAGPGAAVSEGGGFATQPFVSPGQRDWAGMGRVDMKPVQPLAGHVHVVSSQTMATTDHPYATEAALWALERGGTAADAYISVSLAQCVLEPTMTTLGGAFGMTFYDAAARELAMAGGGLAFPSGVPAEQPYDEAKSWTGWGAMVPGYVRGVEAAHEAFGRLSWEELWEPAIAFAESGFVIDHMLWGYLHHSRKMVGRFAGPGRDNWFRDGYLLGVGDTVYLPELAETMKQLRDQGPGYFYSGPFARALVDEVARRGGGISLADLEAIGGVVSPPWKSGEEGAVSYRGYEVAPFSGSLYQLGLQVCEQADLRGMGPSAENPETLHLQIRLMQELWHRGAEMGTGGEPEFVSCDHAAQVLQAIRTEPPRPFLGFAAATCGVVIVDAEGNVAGGTHSSSSEPFGTGINVGGVVMNRATYLRKYLNIPQGLSTQLWLFRDGGPALVMATPSRSLTECLLEGAANFVEFEMEAREAVEAPRFGHPHPGMTAIEIEGDFGEEALAELESRGHSLFPVSPKDANMGSVHAVRAREDGRLEGVADPRRRGLARGA